MKESGTLYVLHDPDEQSLTFHKPIEISVKSLMVSDTIHAEVAYPDKNNGNPIISNKAAILAEDEASPQIPIVFFHDLHVDITFF